MDYWRSDRQESLPRILYPELSSEATTAGIKRRLRVLLLGDVGAFGPLQHVLVANIRHWGYEAVVLPSSSVYDLQTWRDVEGDILLYDMDASLPRTPVLENTGSEHTSYLAPYPFAGSAGWPKVWLTIALSSHSVSRLTLEHMGAITLLHKPFDMRHLERYLHVFQQLLYREQARSLRTGELPMFAGRIRRLFVVGEEGVEEASKTVRILVADDCLTMTHMICQCLLDQDQQRYQYDVREVHDGLDLLEQCLLWQPHCVITDLLMPWLNGYQVMRCLAVANSAQQVPAFVVISALMRHEIPGDRPYLQDRAVLYIDKPFEVETLLASVEQALAE